MWIADAWWSVLHSLALRRASRQEHQGSPAACKPVQDALSRGTTEGLLQREARRKRCTSPQLLPGVAVASGPEHPEVPSMDRLAAALVSPRTCFNGVY